MSCRGRTRTRGWIVWTQSQLLLGSALCSSVLASPPDSPERSEFGPHGEVLRVVDGRGGAETPGLTATSTALRGPFTVADTDSGTWLSRPQLMPDRLGRVHVLYCRKRPVHPKLIIEHAVTENGRVWYEGQRATLDSTRGRIAKPPGVVVATDIEALLWSGLDSEFVEFVAFWRPGSTGPVQRFRQSDGTDPEFCGSDVCRLVAHDEGITAIWDEYVCETGYRSVAATSRDGGDTWSPAQVLVPRLWSDLLSAPSVAKLPDGDFLVAVGSTGPPLLLYRATPGINEWESLGLPAFDWPVMAPNIAVSPAGEICLVYSLDDPGPTSRVYATTSPDDGASWSAPTEITEGFLPDINNYEPHIAWGGGTWHIAWITNPPWDRPVNAYYTAWSGPGDVVKPVRVNAVPDDVEANVPYSIDIATDGLGYAHIVWGQTYPGGVESYAILAATTRPEVIPVDPPDGLQPLPHPFRTSVTLRASGLAGAAATVRIWDAAGRAVRSWTAVPITDGTIEVAWDGRGGGGHPVPAGVFFWDVLVDRSDVPLRGKVIRFR